MSTRGHREPRCFELCYKDMLETGKIYQIVCPVFEEDRPAAFLLATETHDHI